MKYTTAFHGENYIAMLSSMQFFDAAKDTLIFRILLKLEIKTLWLETIDSRCSIQTGSK